MYSFSNTLHVLRDFLDNDMPTVQKTLQGIQGDLHKGKLDTRATFDRTNILENQIEEGSNF